VHRPDVEELVTHLVRVHGCDETRAMIEVSKREAMIEVQNAGLVAFTPAFADGTPQPKVINLTEGVAERLFEQYSEFEALHTSHHDSRILAMLAEGHPTEGRGL
jgi:hypothetical protein